MTDRKQTIATLTEHLDHWKRLLSEGICTKDEGERTIDALKFAIASLKTDEAYDIIYEGLDVIPVPEGATNGDMIKAVFPNVEPKVVGYTEYIGDTEVNCREVVLGDRICIEEDWWNSSYRKGQK